MKKIYEFSQKILTYGEFTTCSVASNLLHNEIKCFEGAGKAEKRVSTCCGWETAKVGSSREDFQ